MGEAAVRLTDRDAARRLRRLADGRGWGEAVRDADRCCTALLHAELGRLRSARAEVGSESYAEVLRVAARQRQGIAARQVVRDMRRHQVHERGAVLTHLLSLHGSLRQYAALDAAWQRLLLGHEGPTTRQRVVYMHALAQGPPDMRCNAIRMLRRMRNPPRECWNAVLGGCSVQEARGMLQEMRRCETVPDQYTYAAIIAAAVRAADGGEAERVLGLAEACGEEPSTGYGECRGTHAGSTRTTQQHHLHHLPAGMQLCGGTER
eukprot:Hpha_TRINITY_DN16643_c0_g3::TRINITY_DN16643_c0_g3_i2::g.181888::m.181888